MHTKSDYQLGLLNLVHLLISADGVIDEQEKDALQNIMTEENIDEEVIRDFETTASKRKEQDIYNEGINLLSRCSEEEKLCALVHLYRLAEADNFIHIKELKMLMYALKMTRIEFEDVVLSANLAKSFKKEFQFLE
jgi:uncharacterized tellurite resistance protein B-like protein